MRFVHYYEALLRHGAPPVFAYRLKHVRLRTTPMADITGGCTPFFDVRVNGVVVFDYRKATGKKLRRHKRGEPFIDLDLTRFDVRIAGNVKIQLYHEAMAGNVKLCHLWFHTGFVSRNYLVFSRSVIDKANKDKKGIFAHNFGVELYMDRVAPTGTGTGTGDEAGSGESASGGSGAGDRDKEGGGAGTGTGSRKSAGLSGFPSFSLGSGHHRSPFTSGSGVAGGGDLYEAGDATGLDATMGSPLAAGGAGSTMSPTPVRRAPSIASTGTGTGGARSPTDRSPASSMSPTRRSTTKASPTGTGTQAGTGGRDSAAPSLSSDETGKVKPQAQPASERKRTGSDTDDE